MAMTRDGRRSIPACKTPCIACICPLRFPSLATAGRKEVAPEGDSRAGVGISTGVWGLLATLHARPQIAGARRPSRTAGSHAT